MKNPAAKLVVASVVVIVCVVGVSLWKTTGPGIALADVLAQVQQSTAYMYQMTMSATGKGPGGLDMNQNSEGTVLIAPDYGMRITMDMPAPNGGEAHPVEMYILPVEKVMITLMPAAKQYMRAEFDNTLIEKTRRENYDPSSMLKQILECKHESLGRSVIDGVEVEGFHTTDPNYPAAVAGQVDMNIWVDVKTKLPVREEMDMQMGDMHMHAVVHSFQWNCPVDASTFKPDIPPDYTALLGGTIKIPAVNEDGAIAGLRLCAELTGRYPEQLDIMTVASLIGKLEDKPEPRLELPDPPKFPAQEDTEALDVESLKKIMELPREERAAKMEEHLAKMKEHIQKNEEQDRQWDEQYKKWQEQMEVMNEQLKKRAEQVENMEGRIKETVDKIMPIQGAVMFYMTLAEQKKDPAYYGNIVTPQDAHKVLMRWKLSDSEYRVIYGDLRAETITPEKLVELEVALPK